MTSLQVLYEGHVQGVGFRWSVRHAAKGFDVTGWVRNLFDGRVELQVTGQEDEVRGFLDRVAEGELHALIHKQTENRLDKPVAARGFEIRYDKSCSRGSRLNQGFFCSLSSHSRDCGGEGT